MGKRKGDEKINPIQTLVQEGISEIIKNNPRLSGYETYFYQHLDKKGLENKISDVYALPEFVGLQTQSEQEAFFKNYVTNLISSAEVFDDSAKVLILKKRTLNEKKGLSWLLSRGELRGVEKLDKTMQAFYDLYNIFSQGNYAQQMPEVAKSLEEMSKLRFIRPALRVLAEGGHIKKSNYEKLDNGIIEKTYDLMNGISQQIQQYAIYQKAAVFIFGVVGVLALILSGSSFTGAVIGVSPDNFISLGVLPLFASFLFLVRVRRNNKRLKEINEFLNRIK